MAAIVLQRRATRPPGGAPRIDWSNPITQGMEFCYVMGGNGCVLGGGRGSTKAIAYAGALDAVGGEFAGARTNTVSTKVCDIGAGAVAGASDYSFIAVGSNPSSNVQMALDDDDGTTRNMQFRVGSTGVGQIIVFNTSGTAFTAGVAVVRSKVSGFVIGASVAGTAVAAYSDGKKGTVTVTGTPRTPGSTLAVGARKNLTTAWNTGALSLVAGWARALTDAEHQALADNPWQLFRAPDLFFSDGSTASDTSLSASLTANANMSASLTTSIPLAANLTAGAGLSADLTTSIPLSATLAASAMLAADLTTAIPLEAAAAAQATMSASLTTSIPLSCTMAARASLSAEFEGSAAQLSCALSCAPSIAADLTTAIPLAANLGALATLAPQLTTEIRLSAGLAAVATLNASLSTGGAPVLTPAQILKASAEQRIYRVPAERRILTVRA